MRPRNNRRLGLAVALLLVVALSLIAVLILLPSGSRTAGSRFRPAPQEKSSPTSRPRDTGAGGAGAAPSAPTVPPERPKPEAAIALVIDDVGYDLDTLREFLQYPGPITFAVLPHLPHTREAVRMIREAGQEMLLHLPMEALNGEDPGPGAIRSSQSDTEILRLVTEGFAEVEGAVGANNHMGSRATADPRVMAVVMEYLADKKLFFLDSRTTAESQAARAARAASVGFVERNVFLDNTPEQPSMRAAFDKGVALARAQGGAVLIGHVQHPRMLGILEEVLKEAHPFGVQLVPLSSLVRAAEGLP